MTSIALNLELFDNVKGKVAIVTGAAGGIGAETARVLHEHGAKVVLADLSSSQAAVEAIVSSLGHDRAVFIPANILNWSEMQQLFKKSIEAFGRVDIVVANAGLMESKAFYDFEVDEAGDLKEAVGSSLVIDVNLKGTMNTLRLAMFYMSKNEPDPGTSCRGSVVLIASTSGYFGGTGVVSYISSKHGVIGLLRSSQKVAAQHAIRLNAVAPFFTPTFITGGYSEKWKEKGLPANTTTDVAQAIVQTAADPTMSGTCCLAAGQKMNEIERRLGSMVPGWIGAEMHGLMIEGGKFFDDLGGYPLPPARS